uniref:Uncharacterized protein n=1 Tax=Zooxanthella nutricula TaxID=1333877 RepID=A0A6V0E5S1_9DINO
MATKEYAAVAQKVDQVDAELAQEDKVLAAMEADFQAAEARVEVAEARYARSRRAIERELGNGAASPAPARAAAPSGQQEDTKDEEDEERKVDKDPTRRESHASKNTSARPQKEVNRDKWIAARAEEGRVRERATKARERLRRNARDRKFQAAEEVAPAEAPAQADEDKAAAPEEKPLKRDLGLAESAAAKEGAQGIADRVNCLKERSNAAEKRAALLRVLTGGKEEYYTFEPSDVLRDLKDRGLLDGGFDDLLALVAQAAPPSKPAEVPAEGWAAGAKKASGIERLDDKPFKEAEGFYLKSVEEKSMAAAEAELEAAEARLGELVSKAEARFGRLNSGTSDDFKPPPRRQVSGEEHRVDEEEAERLEAQHDPDAHRESRGSKNTSALNPKVVSKEKWESARGKESREREHDKMAREARRAEARDLKQGAADVA